MAAEIDFDELDRAVSSLIGKVPDDTKPDTKVGEEVPVTTDSVTSASVSPVTDAGEKVAVSIVKPASVPIPQSVVTLQPATSDTPAARRATNGRFMDVVHPSADMRPNATDDMRPSLIPSKESASLETSPAAMPGGATDTTLNVSESSLSVRPSENEVIDNEAAQLDSLLTKDLSLDEPPQTSPFLPNAKVEKRPLGSFSSDATDSATPGAVQIIDTPVSSNDSVPADTPAIATAATLKPSDDLVKAVEDEQAKAAAKAAEDEAQAKEEEKKADVAKLDAEAQINLTSDMNTPLPEELQSDVLAIEAVATPAADASAVPLSTGATSIVPQYKEKASSAKPSGAIYDTEAYHKPLQHPVQKKSGLLLVLVIVGIIIVGGSVGAAVYFIGLPLLQ